jgi:hypothetical protein
VIRELSIAKQNPQIKYTVFIGHRPLICSDFDNIPILPDCSLNLLHAKPFIDIFAKYNVDLLVTGHVHMYTRVKPLNINLDYISMEERN